MKNKRVIIIWFLEFALSVFFLLILPKEYTMVVWITLIFTAIAFLGQLLHWLFWAKNSDNAQGVFYKTPAMLISALYLGVQFVLCLVTGALSKSLSFKAVLIVNFVVLVLAWAIILALGSSRYHIQRVDSRQKDHHVEL